MNRWKDQANTLVQQNQRSSGVRCKTVADDTGLVRDRVSHWLTLILACPPGRSMPVPVPPPCPPLPLASESIESPPR